MGKIILFLVLAMVAIDGVAKAKAVKCNSGFLRVSDLKYKVVKSCGEPLSIETISGDDDIKVERATYQINGWVYDIIYRAGTVRQITRLGRR